MEVLVIGAGVIGCSIARALAGAGVDVVVVESRKIGGGATSAAAGMLAPLAESHDPGHFSRLALAGLQAFHDEIEALETESGIDTEYRRDGILRVAESDSEEVSLRASLNWQASAGIEAEWLDGTSLHALEPMLAESIQGALYAPREGHVNAIRLVAALAASAARRGARMLEGCVVEGFALHRDRVTSVRSSSGALAADHVIIANGAWSGLWSKATGIDLDVFPVRGQMAALAQTPPPIRRIIYSGSGYLVPKADGSIYAGATEEEDAEFNETVTSAGLRWLLGAAARLVPVLDQASVVRTWAGLRPCAPDRLPILGPVPGLSNVSVATAHFRNGILLSLITGSLIAATVLGQQPSFDLTPFAPGRLLSVGT